MKVSFKLQATRGVSLRFRDGPVGLSYELEAMTGMHIYLFALLFQISFLSCYKDAQCARFDEFFK